MTLRQTPIISIVDDDEGVRSSLENYLRAAGVAVRTFGSAETFLASADRLETDCLITDLHMPGMDGLALQEELNRIGRAFPVIVMTAFPTDSAREEAAALGAAAFLTKPVDPDALLDRVEEILPQTPDRA
jgi:FixJ family two-component response regulator